MVIFYWKIKKLWKPQGKWKYKVIMDGKTVAYATDIMDAVNKKYKMQQDINKMIKRKRKHG